jgi:hypothetical protein
MSSDLCWAFVERHSERFLAGRKAAGAGTRDRPVTGFFWKLIRSCRLDPDLLQAHVWLARVSAGRVAYGWSDTEDADLREGIDAVVRAIHIDEKSPVRALRLGDYERVRERVRSSHPGRGESRRVEPQLRFGLPGAGHGMSVLG